MISMWYVDDERMNATTNILFIAHFYAIWMEKHIFVKIFYMNSGEVFVKIYA